MINIITIGNMLTNVSIIGGVGAVIIFFGLLAIAVRCMSSCIELRSQEGQKI